MINSNAKMDVVLTESGNAMVRMTAMTIVMKLSVVRMRSKGH